MELFRFVSNLLTFVIHVLTYAVLIYALVQIKKLRKRVHELENQNNDEDRKNIH